MHELTVNLHIHTTYSDGTGSHDQIASAGLKKGIDVLLVTDHNILVDQKNKYYQSGDKKLLLLTGEEIHDKKRTPQKNHLLVFNTNKELCTFAEDPQNLINQVKRYDGLCFIAHPFEKALTQVNEGAISWENWEVSGYNGIELWNHFSELKSRTKNWPQLLLHIFFPALYTMQPEKETLNKWDELLSQGKKIVAVGGSDSHALNFKAGPFKKVVFPYSYHFSTINTHILTPNPLTGDLLNDQKMIYAALEKGHAFVGNDLFESTKGFRFTAQGLHENAIMGDSIQLHSGVTFQIAFPIKCESRLIHNGKIVKTWENDKLCTYITKEPGVYRIEAYLHDLGKKRGWIFSNPIYVENKRN